MVVSSPRTPRLWNLSATRSGDVLQMANTRSTGTSFTSSRCTIYRCPLLDRCFAFMASFILAYAPFTPGRLCDFGQLFLLWNFSI